MSSLTKYFIEIFDFNGTRMNVNIFGKEKHQTLIGSIIGLSAIGAIFSVSVIFIINFLQKTQLTIIYNDDSNVMPVNNITRMPFMFGLFDALGNPINDDKVYYFQMKKFNYANAINADGQKRLTTTTQEIKISRCSESLNTKDYSEYFPTSSLFHFFCLDQSVNLTLWGKFGDTANGFSMFQLYLNKCDNKTGGDCMDSDVIDNMLDSVYVSLLFIDNEIDNYNVTHPYKHNEKGLVFSVSSLLLKRYYLKFQQVLYDTDMGIVFEDHETINFFTFNSYTSEVDLKSAGLLTSSTNIAAFTFENSSSVAYYYRSYVKLQTVLANIGGVIKGITTISAFISSVFTRKLAYLDISNSTFLFYKKENPQNEKRIILTAQNFPHKVINSLNKG